MEENKEKNCGCGPDCGSDCECSCHKHDSCNCGCHHKKIWHKKKYAFSLIALGLILVTAVAIVSLLRQRIVNPTENQITVYGEGKVEYTPDTATITLGMKVDKAASASEAMTQMNDQIKKITDAVKALGVPDKDIKTQNYSLRPAYDYKDGTSTVAGYNASQNLQIKAEGVDRNTDLVNKIVEAAGNAGTNNVQGINYFVNNPSDLQQKARIAAIEDARSKAGALAAAAGIKKLGKVLSWYEDVPNSGPVSYNAADSSMGLGAGPASPKAVSTPSISSGTQDITVDMGVIFQVN